MNRILVILVLLVAMLVGAMVWSGGKPQRRADFAFINRGDIHTLDLNKMSYMQDFRLTYGIREGLYNLDGQTFEPVPAGAARHELSEDKKTWTFHLRPDAKWSNGDPVTAYDYIFSWKRMLVEPGEYTYLFYYIKNARDFEQRFAAGDPVDVKAVGMEAVNDLTFRLTLNNPVPYLLDVVAFPPFYPRHEKSMAAFRTFTDEDVMDVFTRCVRVDDVTRLKAELPGAKNITNETAAAFASAARKLEGGTFEGRFYFKNVEADVVDALVAFAAMEPFGPRPANLPKAKEDEDAFGILPPAEKLARMASARFVRYVFDKGYTRPPHVVTNGPFVLKRWDFKRSLWLEKSETYWDRANVKSNTLEMVVAENPQGQLLLYDRGLVDWNSDVTGEQAAELKKERTDLRTSPAFGTAFLTLMCRPKLPASLGGGDNPLADVRVRQALAMSIDKDAIVQTVTRMGELPARTYLPPDGTLPQFIWQPGVHDTRKEPYRFEELQKMLPTEQGRRGGGPGLPYDPEKARDLLAQAGYPGGKGFPRLPILYNSNNPTRRQYSQMLKDQWQRNLNIEIDIRQVEGKVFSQQLSDKDYWIGTAAWYGDYPDVSTFTDKYKSASLQNDSAWENKAYDELCDRAESEPDERKRIELLSRAEHMIDTEVPIIPLYHYVNISMFPDNVRGVRANPRNITIFKDVWVDRKGSK